MHSGIWQDFAQQLAQHYQVTCLDLPGHGGSEKITPYTLEQISDALVDAITDERSCWLGWSLGATVVLDIAQRYPERVDALILLSGNPCFIQKSHETATEAWPGMKTIVLEQFANQLSENGMMTLVRFLSLQVQGLSNTKGFLKQLKVAAAQYPAPDTDTLQGGLEILKHTDLTSTLATMDKPVLTLLGGRDALVPIAVGQALLQCLPTMQLHCIEQAAHAPFLSHEQETLTIISRFMAELCH